MKVSVVIPVRKEKHIEACLDAVFDMDFLYPYEVIVIENDESQELKEVICRYPVRYECEPDIGSYKARNRGIRVARGEIIAFLDANGVPCKHWLTELVRGFSSEEIAGAAGRFEKKLSSKGAAAKYQREFLLDDGLQFLRPIFPAPYAPGGNAAYRKDVLTELGGFDTNFFSGGDVDISWRVQLAGYRLVYCREALVNDYPRTTIKAYFKQYYKYSLGQVMLFKKYRQYTGKRILFNSYPFLGIVQALKKLFTNGLYHLAVHRDISYVLGRMIDLVEHGALLAGAFVGSIRYKVFYI